MHNQIRLSDYVQVCHYDVYMPTVFEDPLFYLIDIQNARLPDLKIVLWKCYIRCLNELQYNKTKSHQNIPGIAITSFD